MSEYDDRQPAQQQPSPGQPGYDEVSKMREQAMHEMWQGLKEKLRSFFQKSEGEHKGPPH